MTIDVTALQGSAAGLIAFVVILVLTGRLVPRSVVNDLRKDRDDQVKAAKEETALWRQAYELKDQQDKTRDHQVEQLLTAAQATEALFKTLKTKVDEGSANASSTAA